MGGTDIGERKGYREDRTGDWNSRGSTITGLRKAGLDLDTEDQKQHKAKKKAANRAKRKAAKRTKRKR